MNTTTSKHAQVIGIASGKGGVGKTTFAANLACYYAAKGKRVLIFDADIGFANIHIALRCALNGTMTDVIEGRKSISEIIVTSSQGVSIVSGGNGLETALAIDMNRASAVIHAFAELESQFDVMLVDISAGGNEGVLRFLSACHHQIVIGTNEPSSIADAYALIKLMSFTMGLDNVVFLPNRVKTSQEGRLLFDKMNIITAKHLGFPLKYIGSLSESFDYSQAWSSGTTAISLGNSTVAYLDFKNIISELEKLTFNHKNSELQFFRPK